MKTKSKLDAMRAAMEAPSDSTVTVAPRSGAERRRAKRLDYVHIPGQISLSYSRLGRLHTCPRRFYLNEVERVAPISSPPSIHTSFGSAYGAGIGELWRTKDLDSALAVAFCFWDYDDWDDMGLGSSRIVKDKSFWECCQYIENFHTFVMPTLLDQGWDLAYIDEQPALETTFFIQVNSKYNYQGHIDIVLFNEELNQYGVYECKTSKNQHFEAQWGNSGQTDGYHTIIQHLAQQTGANSSSEIIYHTLQTGQYDNAEKDYGIKLFRYQKTEISEVNFLADILSDVNTMELYSKMGHWPKRGNACMSFGRVCDYYGICDLSPLEVRDELSIDIEQQEEFSTLALENVDIVLDLSSYIENTD